MKLLRVLPIQDTANMRDRRKLSEGNIDRLRVCIDDIEPNCQSPTDKTFIKTGQRENKHLSISGPRRFHFRSDDLKCVFACFEYVHTCLVWIILCRIKVHLNHKLVSFLV
jgi:hypothetical protein